MKVTKKQRGVDAEYRRRIRADGRAEPPADLVIVDARRPMSRDWWVQTVDGAWYWLRGESSVTEWKHAPLGPPGWRGQ